MVSEKLLCERTAMVTYLTARLRKQKVLPSNRNFALRIMRMPPISSVTATIMRIV